MTNPDDKSDKSGDKSVDTKYPTGVSVVGIPGTDRRLQNPGIAATEAFAVNASGNM